MLATHSEFTTMRQEELTESGSVEWGRVSEELLAAGDHRAKGYVQYAANCVEAVISVCVYIGLF